RHDAGRAVLDPGGQPADAGGAGGARRARLQDLSDLREEPGLSSIDRLGAIVLAGSRGPDDPVARAGGLQHKAFVPVAGVPMLQRVLDTLAQVPRIGRVVVVGVPQLPPNAGPLTTLLEAAPTPSLSVLRGLD